MKTTLIVCTLNELDGLKKIMPQIKPEWYDQLIMLVGKPIKDNTLWWCKEQGYETFVGEVNLWDGYRKLFNLGTVKGDIAITFSPDGNSIPEVIPQLIEAMKDKDLVIASRYLDGASSEDDTQLTRFGNWLLTKLVNLRSGFKYTDALVMYRAYRTKIIKDLGFLDKPTWLQRQLIKLTGLYSWEPSMAIRAGKIPLRIGEIPANEPKASRERRQNTLVHGFAILTQIIHEGWFR